MSREIREMFVLSMCSQIKESERNLEERAVWLRMRACDQDKALNSQRTAVAIATIEQVDNNVYSTNIWWQIVLHNLNFFRFAWNKWEYSHFRSPFFLTSRFSLSLCLILSVSFSFHSLILIIIFHIKFYSSCTLIRPLAATQWAVLCSSSSFALI